MDKVNSTYFETSDGVQLHYDSTGDGQPLILIPGGGFSAKIFKYQISALAQNHQVFALDNRGHGQSEKVNFGYNIARFAKDLFEFINHLKLDSVTLLGHSLGSSVIFRYIDLFGCDKIKKLIIVDEPPVLLINPAWGQHQCEQFGAIYKADELHALTDSFLQEDITSLRKQIIDKMTTDNISDKDKRFLLECMDLPGTAAQKLYFNNICQDFRDVLRKITVPTLFITGKASLSPWQAFEWMQQQVPDSQLVIFEKNEGGNHFMFVENPEKFNRIVLDFIANDNHVIQ